MTSLPLLERSAAADSVEKTGRELIRPQTSNLRRLVVALLPLRLARRSLAVYGTVLTDTAVAGSEEDLLPTPSVYAHP